MAPTTKSAATSLLVIASVIQLALSLHYLYRLYRRRHERQSIQPEADSQGRHITLSAAGLAASPPQEAEALVQEQLTRNYAFLGDQGMARLRDAFVVILGCGGVGAHAAHMLARSGIGKLRLIDFDTVSLSSLNRAPLATRADVGLLKVRSLATHLSSICPWLQLESLPELFTESKAPSLLSGAPDYVLDCIDQIDSKVELLEYCYRHDIPVLSSMGAGAKLDPTKIAIADIKLTREDPLARAVRRRLQKKGISSGIKVVYSCERPNGVSLLPFELDDNGSSVAESDGLGIDASSRSQGQRVSEYAILPEFRARILPVLGPLPALFGTTMAVYVIRALSRFEASSAGTNANFSSVKSSTAANNRYLRDLVSRERRLQRSRLYAENPGRMDYVEFERGPFPVSLNQVAYLVESLWQSQSAIRRADTCARPKKLVLVRWRKELALSPQNLILLTTSEANTHERARNLDDIYSPDWISAIDRKLSCVKLEY